MAVCKFCNREMLETDGCDCDPIPYAGGESLPRVPYGSEKRADWSVCGERCPDCNAKLGQPHHWGCDVEECPRCHHQLITCACTLEGEQ